MTGRDHHNQYDIILIGAGFGGSAAARILARAGKSVAIVPGAGRSRSLEADGGLVGPDLVESAFGAGAPLGGAVNTIRHFTAPVVTGTPKFGPLETMPERRSFRRLELERWALDRAIDAGAVFLDDFVEGRVVPSNDGGLTLVEEGEGRSILARTIVLCEGSDPRIAMRAGLRPDYPPEEQIHFARVILAQPPEPIVCIGRTRTSWGMPIGVAVTPLGSVTLVTADSRIENVMRGAKSTQDALVDLLSSRLGGELGLHGERLHTGIELSAMRSSGRNLSMAHGGLLLGIDASGMLDMRGVDRADITIRSGRHLGQFLVDQPTEDWDTASRELLRQIEASDPGWHDSRKTGYIEESSSADTLKSAAFRLARGVTGRFRKG
ncbi:MAG TPA: hypothetical protein VNZ58_13435 [Thermomicrobiales bacterium]|nr:hypothetical protein [Thermomicrobiales bacterium]